ncbi:hypothetical protein BX666DRAFT_2023605 [Dichotomocladium elegans]|nr:hypothetical protein BX666DRAFT_2023605 [Dichotomocladium elegans]
MPPVINHLRGLSLSPSKQKRTASSKRKKSLCVKISKDPPVIHKFEQDNLESSFECIFDPLVLHDDESDHPELLYCDGKKRLCKAYDIPGYVREGENRTMTTMFKRFSAWSPKLGGKAAASPSVPPV